MSNLAQTIHRAVTDQAFRDALTANPVTTLSHHGLELSEHEVDALSSAICLLDRASEDLLLGLLDTANGAAMVWRLKEKPKRYSVLKP